MTSIRLDQLDHESQAVLTETMAILDEWWDEEAGLLRLVKRKPDARG